MPVFFQELPRPAHRQRARPGALAKLALINVAVLGTVAAIWFALPQPAHAPARRTATIKPGPLPPEGRTSATTAERVRPAMADPLPVGSIKPMPAPQRPQGPFREIQRAAPQDYVGFREVGSGR